MGCRCIRLSKKWTFFIGQIENDAQHMKKKRNWKPLLGAYVPSDLWPQLLQKAHAALVISHNAHAILLFSFSCRERKPI
jgi:3-deoxy-D-manno-octulosonic-acid transferase